MKSILASAAALAAFASLSGCANTAPEPISWKLEREAYAARVRMHECRDAVAAGQRTDCKAEIKDAYQAQRDREMGRFSDVGNAGYTPLQ